MGNHNDNTASSVGKSRAKRDIVFGSAFDDLPGPELYDAAWNNNKFRCEFGTLGKQQLLNSGPQLPRSYHVASSSASDNDSDSNLADVTQQVDDDVPFEHDTFQSFPRLSNAHEQDDDDEKQSCFSSPASSPIVAQCPSEHEKRHPSLCNSTSPCYRQPSLCHEQSRTQLDNRLVNTFCAKSSGRTSSMLSQSPLSRIQSPVEKENSDTVQNVQNGRVSRRFRKSRRFIGGGAAGLHTTCVPGPMEDANLTPGRTGQGASLCPTKRNDKRSTIFGKWAPVSMTLAAFGPASVRRNDLEIDSVAVPKALDRAKEVLQFKYLAKIIAVKDSEIRCSVPFQSCHQTKIVIFNIIVTCESLANGCKVSVRRTFADSLRGAHDLFDSFCSELFETLGFAQN